MLTGLDSKMSMMILMGLLMGAGCADVVPYNTAVFYNNGTLLSPNAHGEMTLYDIVDLTWELNIGASNKINITGSADMVIDYINSHFPDYIWPDVDESNTTSSEKTPQDDPKPNCLVYDLAPYPTANDLAKGLQQQGSHFVIQGPKPHTCGEVRCHADLMGRTAAIWWCNDALDGATTSAKELGDLAGQIIDTCVEFAVPFSWTRGQLYHKLYPYNVLVTGNERCRWGS